MKNPTRHTDESWTIADLIDFEVLVDEDKSLPPDDLKKRDRAIAVATEHGHGEESRQRQWWFHVWLRARKHDRFSDKSSPGEEVHSYFQSISLCIGLAGFVAAASVVAGLFHGTSLRDKANSLSVDVTWYFLWCVLVPFLWSMVSASLLVRRQRAYDGRSQIGPIRRLILDLLDRSMHKIAHLVSEVLPPEKRLAGNALRGVLKKRWEVRRDVVWAEFIRFLQVFGVSVTCSIVIVTLFITITGHSYTWSTDWGLTDSSVHQLVGAIASPWSWVSVGVPSLDQVHSTQAGVIGREAVAGSATAWRNFLVFSVITYGVVPRVLLWLWSVWLVRRALKQQDFDEPRFDPLWHRLTTPIVEVPPGPDSGPIPPPPQEPRPHVQPISGSCSLIVPSDIDNTYTGLVQAVAEHLLNQRLEVGHAVVLPDSPKAFSEKIKELPKQPAYVLHQACMWQTGDLFDLLRDIRSAVVMPH